VVDNQVYRSYITAFQACYRSYTYPEDFYTDPEAESEVSDGDSNNNAEEQAEEHPLADFEAFARRQPLGDFTRADLLDSLGTREVDCNYNWSLHVGCSAGQY
jgi:hypothetical protein